MSHSLVLYLQSLLARAAQPRKRRRGGDAVVPILDLLNTDDESPVRRKPVKGSRVPQPPKPLKEIRGRAGDGPFDLAAWAKSQPVTNLSPMDLWQVCPDSTKAFKNLSTRMTEKTRVRQRRIAAMKKMNPKRPQPTPEPPVVNTKSTTILQPTQRAA
ncbi:hypothetical protein EV127DRAFT_407083 [Xylaria flabelliformis]|nr:hypothetical protein EV127DRAFT_407083 [Xylaria flabelliformis]